MFQKRHAWGSKLGIIMAVAGSAVGLGNFLRFPGMVAANGGGAFMVPYFLSLFLLGLPLMWIEWTLGRYGGGFGHGTAPGIFHAVWKKNRFIKYFGVIGIFGPLVILMYYVFIESWTLAFSFFSLTGRYAQAAQGSDTMRTFLHSYQGIGNGPGFNGLGTAYAFFLVTFAINTYVLHRGVKGGIETLCNIAMPLLFVFGVVLMVRVLTLGTPDPARPDWNLGNGLGFLWNPDWSALLNARVWLKAAGQIFFTLSVGIGVILTYASYLDKEKDVVLSGLTATSTNEMAEVILGGSIVIPAAFVFFGPHDIHDIATSGLFNMGFVTMPLIFQKIPLGQIFGALWFLLLFLAGITSSVSLAEPVIAFLEDEFRLTRKRAVLIFAAAAFVLCQPAVLFLANGVVDELDFWGGTFCLVLFGTVETILFGWVFGMDNAWQEIHQGADLTIPRAYRFIIKYVTPVLLLAILGFWLYDEGMNTILLRNVAPENRPYILWTRAGLLALFTTIAVLVKIAWNRRRQELNP